MLEDLDIKFTLNDCNASVLARVVLVCQELFTAYGPTPGIVMPRITSSPDTAAKLTLPYCLLYSRYLIPQHHAMVVKRCRMIVDQHPSSCPYGWLRVSDSDWQEIVGVFKFWASDPVPVSQAVAWHRRGKEQQDSLRFNPHIAQGRKEALDGLVRPPTVPLVLLSLPLLVCCHIPLSVCDHSGTSTRKLSSSSNQ